MKKSIQWIMAASDYWLGGPTRRPAWSLLLGLLVAQLLGGCAHQAPHAAAPAYDPADLQARSLEYVSQIRQQSGESADRDYVIGPLDVLDITVFEVPRYTTVVRVSGDGTIRFPDLGVIRAGGLSERRLEEQLHRLFREKRLLTDPQVMVFVKELHARTVAISGEVKTPGAYPLQGGETLMDMISKAGGLTPTAGRYAYILRGAAGLVDSSPTQSLVMPAAAYEATTLQVDLVALLLRGQRQWDLPLRAGDRVTIPTVGFVHVTGQGVEKPGTYALRSEPNMLSQAIDDAGGLKFVANNRLRIVRRTPHGSQETFSVDYRTIRKDANNDVAIRGGDTVLVDRTVSKTVLFALWTAAEKMVRFGFDIQAYIPISGSRRGY